MSLVSRSLLLLCTLPLAQVACVSQQQLGDPQATEGDPQATDGESRGTDSDDTASVEGSETGAGSTENGESSSTDASSSTAGESGVGSETEGETDGSSAVCAEWAPPPFDCPVQGESRAGLEIPADESSNSSGGDEAFVDGAACEVTALDSDGLDRWTVGMQCDDRERQFTYMSAAPYVSPPVEIGSQVIYTGIDGGTSNYFRPAVSLHTPQGDLLLAFIDHGNFDDPLALDIAPLQVDYAHTGCGGFADKEWECGMSGEPGAVVLKARMSVLVEGDDVLEVSEGGTGTVSAGGTSYRVTVETSESTVCADEGCFSDGAAREAVLRMLIVAET